MRTIRRSRAVSLDDRLGALAEAVELAEGRLEAAQVGRARAVVERAGVRRGLSVDHTVVALAGATGSGKSSLFNALSGTSLSTVGVTRPTTSAAQAAMWDPEGSGGLLDWLEVPRRHAVDGDADALSGLVLLDLPDHDSIELAHRLEVDRLVEVVDLLVWVLDPQKYADAAVHERYLRRLRRHQDVMVIVLNQVDRLSPTAADRCLADLRRLLEEDGLSGVPVVATSVTTGAGLDELRTTLVKRVSDRRAWAARLAADVGTAADALAAGAGEGGTADGSMIAVPARTGAAAAAGGSAAAEGSAAAAGGSVAAAGGSAVKGAGRPVKAAGRPVKDAVAGRSAVKGAGRPVKGSVADQVRPLTVALAEAAGVPVVVAAVAKAHRHRAVAATGWPVTRWLRRLRPDPLRRLRLGGPAGGRATVTSIPRADTVQRSRMDLAVRDAGAAASAGLAEPWATAVRRSARSHTDELADRLDRAVATTTAGAGRRPRWWRAVGVMQWLLFATMLAGALWLAGLFFVDYLRLPEVPTPTLGRLPWPTAILAGGALAGLLVALLSRLAAALGGRRRARKTRRALTQAVETVARDLVLTPAQEELTRAHRFSDLLAIARG
ncbi:YfjP family GTPase [Sphaerisporangium aureirubrum]|uniref:YfjP family GTPase n=1 Tax=Sphaerisporangium aureirubrum TaxID=1544736 RepID=A0ABW1NRZ4_9ACTN